MEAWLGTCLLLCLYGFFKEVRPSEPFLTEYLISPPMNLTKEETLVATDAMNYHELNYISLGSVSVAFLIACLLPPVSTSIYFHRHEYIASSEGDSSRRLDEAGGKTWRTKLWFTKVMKLIWEDFKTAYSNTYLLKWSIWWAFATCGNFQAGNYIQPLWETIAPMEETEEIYNGLVEALSTLMGALSAFAVGYLHLNWSLFGEGAMSIISLIDGLLLIFLGLTSWIWVGYVNYILFRASYQVMITIASFQVAKELRADSYGLIFGINMFIALFLQSLLTLIVVQVLGIEPRMQFVIYGSYFLVLAFFFFILASYSCGKLGVRGIREAGMWDEQNTTENQEAPVGTTEVM